MPSHLKYTRADKQTHVNNFLKSQQTQQTYCDANGLKLSSFKNWLSRYHTKAGGHFKPIINLPKKSLHIEVDQGSSKIIICDIHDTEQAILTLRKILQCS